MNNLFDIFSELAFCAIGITIISLLYYFSNNNITWSIAIKEAKYANRIIAAVIDYIRILAIFLVIKLIMHIYYTTYLSEDVYTHNFKDIYYLRSIRDIIADILILSILAYQDTLPRQTYGKRIARLRLVRTNGSSPSWLRALIRYLLSVFLILEIISSILGIKKNFYDILTDTRLVGYENEMEMNKEENQAR